VEQREFMDIRRSGLVAMGLLPGDLLRWAKRTDGDQRILMATADGQCILFHESDVRAMGRQAAGVRGIKLRQGDQVVCMDVVGAEDSHVLVATKKGLGKVSALENYNSQGRGGMGSLTQRVTERSGPVVAARSVRRSDKLMLMLMTEKGKVLRTKIAEISVIGRNTQGVNLMDIDEDDEVAGIAIMRGEEEQSLPELEAADADRPANNGRLL
ncbi:MAG: DNA gyrase subunit A, partial [Chloroflexi bacterium]|nr:DNA gyrase subunit A [Chloroflexota bacterium]